jgi:acetoin utilization deacetylase AcuC-like enzyme
VTTGVFFHPEFRNKDWPIIGDKFRNFPEVIERAVPEGRLHIYESRAATDRELLKVHTNAYLADVRRAWYFKGASLAVGGCIEAGDLIARGELANALAFSVGAGHHSGPSEGWGGTYLSCSGPTIAHIRELFGERRFAIIDTDAHHGDGDRAVFGDDTDVLHVCFCTYNGTSGEGTNVDVNVGYRSSDEHYLSLVETQFLPRVRAFRPFMILHNLGHDTCEGDYGDRGLTRAFFPGLASLVKSCAEVCAGRYLVITHGGARPDIAEDVFPAVAQVLAGQHSMI